MQSPFLTHVIILLVLALMTQSPWREERTPALTYRNKNKKTAALLEGCSCYNDFMDRNYLIDLAHVIMQDAADEWHVKEHIDGLEEELKSVDEKEMPELHQQLKQQLEESKADWVDGAKCRRFATDILAVKSPNSDFHKRCTLKHRATAYVQATEVYLADPDDLTYKLVRWHGERFYKALSEFMGVREITNCGRCLSDQLNMEETKKWADEHGYGFTVGEKETA